MANKKPSKKQPAKKQPAKTAKAQPAKKAVVKKAQPKNQASKKSSAKPKTSTNSTAELEVTFAYTPSPVNITTTANQTPYQITESVLNAIDSTVVRVQDIAQKTLRQRMLAWFKR